jgi:predicted sulfurtransferase
LACSPTHGADNRASPLGADTANATARASLNIFFKDFLGFPEILESFEKVPLFRDETNIQTTTHFNLYTRMNQTPPLTPSTPFKWTLLYYHYFSQKISIKARAELQDMLITSAQRNNLVGRIRVAYDGINATLGAYSKSDLEKHANEISSLHDDFGFNTENTFIDFKYALSEGSRSIEAIEGCRFNTFEAKLVDEIVTMNLSKERANPINTGIHLSPIEFHNGIIMDGSDTTSNIIKADVIIDVRNSYESDIGRFVPPSNVSLLVPNVRTFADMPSYFDSIEESIKGKNIFMYCTGGVRCERASAYIREKGEGFKNVYQLQGGVQRYLEAAERGDLSIIKDKTGELIDSSLWGGSTICI